VTAAAYSSSNTAAFSPSKAAVALQRSTRQAPSHAIASVGGEAAGERLLRHHHHPTIGGGSSGNDAKCETDVTAGLSSQAGEALETSSWQLSSRLHLLQCKARIAELLDLEMEAWQPGRVTVGRGQQQYEASGTTHHVMGRGGPTCSNEQVSAASASNGNGLHAMREQLPHDSSAVRAHNDLAATARRGGVTGRDSGMWLVDQLAVMTRSRRMQEHHCHHQHTGHIRFGCLAVGNEDKYKFVFMYMMSSPS
jgi:hypothetical protein